VNNCEKIVQGTNRLVDGTYQKWKSIKNEIVALIEHYKVDQLTRAINSLAGQNTFENIVCFRE
jgi:hypothetical protein